MKILIKDILIQGYDTKCAYKGVYTCLCIGPICIVPVTVVSNSLFNTEFYASWLSVIYNHL